MCSQLTEHKSTRKSSSILALFDTFSSNSFDPNENQLLARRHSITNTSDEYCSPVNTEDFKLMNLSGNILQYTPSVPAAYVITHSRRTTTVKGKRRSRRMVAFPCHPPFSLSSSLLRRRATAGRIDSGLLPLSATFVAPLGRVRARKA